MNNFLTKRFCLTPLNSAVFSWLRSRYNIDIGKMPWSVCEWEIPCTPVSLRTLFPVRGGGGGGHQFDCGGLSARGVRCAAVAGWRHLLLLLLFLSCPWTSAASKWISSITCVPFYVVPSHPVSVFPFPVRFLKNWSGWVECLCARVSDLQNTRIYYVETT